MIGLDLPILGAGRADRCRRASDLSASGSAIDVAGHSSPNHDLTPRQVSTTEADPAIARLVAALKAAHDARRGLTPELQPVVRAYGRARREAGESVGRVLIEVKRLVREHATADEAVFTPKIVGWTVAGFFEGTDRTE
jgi:hypothetical protein